MYLIKVYTKQKLMKKFPRNSWKERSLRRLLKQHTHASRKRKTTSCAYCRECDLRNLTFSQKGEPHTHQSVLEISRNIGICRSSVTLIILLLFRATRPEENNV